MDAQLSTVIIAAIAVVVPSLTAILAYIKTRETHTIVNSRVDKFVQELRAELIEREVALREELKRARADVTQMRDQLAALNAEMLARRERFRTLEEGTPS